MFKLSSKYFYLNHINEVNKYIGVNKPTLHFINGNEKYEKLFKSNIEKSLTIFTNSIDEFEFINDRKFFYKQLILSNFIENSDNIFNTIKNYESNLTSNHKLIITSVNTKWNFVVFLLSKIKIIKTKFPKNYINIKTLENTLTILGYTLTKHYTRQIFPFKLFYFGIIINYILELLFFKFNLGIKSYFVFRKQSGSNKLLSKTLIIPAKNEEGNLDELISRINLEKNTQIIFIVGASKDQTLLKAKEIAINYENYDFKIIEQNSNGKKNAVHEALPHVKNELVAILDSDISVDPEELNNFFHVIESNLADFVNGTRLVFSMEKGAMRILNNYGNRIFQKLVSFFINEKITDTLCGTKVFKRDLIEKILIWDKSLKYKDPFGDFNFIFTASYQGEKIVDYPVHYRSRKYGKPQINRFRDGFTLFLNLLNSLVKINASKY